MSDLEALCRRIDALSPEDKQRVLDYIQETMSEQKPRIKERIIGLHPGAIIMHNDFDDELPDYFWH